MRKTYKKVYGYISVSVYVLEYQSKVGQLSTVKSHHYQVSNYIQNSVTFSLEDSVLGVVQYDCTNQKIQLHYTVSPPQFATPLDGLCTNNMK